MIFRDKDKPMVAKVLVYLSVGAVALAGIGAVGYDLYLASTQWLLVGVMLGIWGLFVLLEAVFRK
jgi:hypothetical protein